MKGGLQITIVCIVSEERSAVFGDKIQLQAEAEQALRHVQRFGALTNAV